MLPSIWANKILASQQQQEILFVEEYTDWGWLPTLDLAATSDGYYVAYRNGGPNLHLAKIDYFGNIIEQTMWNMGGTIAQTVKLHTDSSHLYVSANQGMSAIYAKFSSTASLVWARRVPNISPEFFSIVGQACVTSDGGVVWPSSYSRNSPNQFFPTLTKFDASGNFLWERRLISSLNALPHQVVEDSSGNLYTAYLNGGNGAVTKIVFVVKLNSSGVLQWVKSFDPEAGSWTLGTCSISIDGSNNLYVLGGSGSRNILAKLDTDGNMIWMRRFDVNISNSNIQTVSAETLATTSSGASYISCWMLKSNNWSSKSWLSFDANGNYVMGREIGVGNKAVNTHSNFFPQASIEHGKLHIAMLLGNYGTDIMTNLPIDGSGVGEYLGSFPLSYREFDTSFITLSSPSVSTNTETFTTAANVHTPVDFSPEITTLDPINLVKHIKPINPFAFNLVNATNNATVNTKDIPIYLTAGQTLRFGTTNLAGASFVGDTFIRLLNPNLTEVVSNDDYGIDVGSYIEHTATVTGTYIMRIGCYSNNLCSGSVAWEIL